MAAIVIASELTHRSKLTGFEQGLRKVAQVIFGCIVGLVVTLAVSRIWPARSTSGVESPRAAHDSPSH